MPANSNKNEMAYIHNDKQLQMSEEDLREWQMMYRHPLDCPNSRYRYLYAKANNGQDDSLITDDPIRDDAERKIYDKPRKDSSMMF